MKWPVPKKKVVFSESDRQALAENMKLLFSIRQEVNKANRKLDEIKRAMEEK